MYVCSVVSTYLGTKFQVQFVILLLLWPCCEHALIVRKQRPHHVNDNKCPPCLRRRSKVSWQWDIRQSQCMFLGIYAPTSTYYFWILLGCRCPVFFGIIQVHCSFEAVVVVGSKTVILILFILFTWYYYYHLAPAESKKNHIHSSSRTWKKYKW